MIAWVLALSLQGELPAYADAVRCAGLAIANHKLLANNDPKSKAAFDASIYWSMAAMERARKDGVDHAKFERDVADATEIVMPGLAVRSRIVRAEVQKCIKRVPR